MPVKLEDIPRGRLTAEEAEALSNETFDYADRERVSMREAQRKVQEKVDDDFKRRQLMRAGEFAEAYKIPRNEPLDTIERGYGDFTFKERAFEFGKAVNRGLGSIFKLPGVALKAIGEAPLDRAEVEKLRESPWAFQRFRARGMESPAGKGARAIANTLRKAGDKYIEFANGFMLDESAESRAVRQQPFWSDPAHRTLMATGESAPSYGMAIASTLTTGNPNIGLFVLGTTTASSSYESLRQQGIDPDLALIGATLEGTIEMVTEKVPMDMLMKGAARPLLIRALSVGTAESFQELLAQLGQNYVREVVKDTDPENYLTALDAARQEWSVIAQGWQDAMAAGFLMGAGGGVFVSGDGTTAEELGRELRSPEQMREDYGFVPRNTNEILSLMEQVKEKVKEVEKQATEETDVGEPEVPPISEITQTPEFKEAQQTQRRKDVAEKFGISEDKAQIILDRQAERQAGKVEGNPLEQEARKHKTAEDFVFAEKTIPIEMVSTPVSREQIIEATGKIGSRHPNEPIVVRFKDGKIEIRDGNNRYYQKLDSGAKTINVVFTPENDSQLTAIWNKAQAQLTSQPIEGVTESPLNIPPIVQDMIGAGIQSGENVGKAFTGAISNIRFGKIKDGKGTVDFDFQGKTLTIPEPDDVVLTAPNSELAAKKWIARKHLGLLAKNLVGKVNEKGEIVPVEGKDYGKDNILITTEEYEQAKAALAETEKPAEEAEKPVEGKELLDRYYALIRKRDDFTRTEQQRKQGIITSSKPALDAEEKAFLEKTEPIFAKNTVIAVMKANGIDVEKTIGKGKNKEVVLKTLEDLQEHPEFKGKTEAEAREVIGKFEKLAEKQRDEAFNKLAAQPQKGKPKKGFRKGTVRIFTPEDLVNVGKVGLYHFEAGLKTFKQWSARMIQEFGDSVKPHLLSLWADLEGRVPLPAQEEIGEGEKKPRGTSVSVMAQAIENEIVEENKELYDEIPQYRAMNMQEQAEKALALIESDLERAKRIAFYKEPAPPDLFPENVFSALRTYAKMTLDVDLIMDLALNEDVVREHTIMGKRIKSLDTDQDYGDPVRAIREVVEARMEQQVRRGADISALEVKLRELQSALDIATKERAAFTKKAERVYGRQNKIVSRTEYDTILARRKKENLGFAGRAGGVAYVPTAQDFADIAKIATFHLEAMGRDFAKWSHQMTRDFGEWITPHLKNEYDKAIAEAAKAGVKIPESKRLTTKKKRLATTTKKLEAKLEEQDLAKVPRIPIELDEEGQRLQEAYNVAREKMKAAQAVANIITEKEVAIIAQLAKDAAERKAVMEKSERRKEGEGATKTEMEYGIAISLFLEYVNDLKAVANKRAMGETIRNYLKNPMDFVSDFAGTLKAAKASLDNSFHLRQGLPTFLKAITGHIPSAKIWWKTFVKSWKMMWQTLHKKKVMRGLFAEMISDPDYELLKKSKVALNVIEEEIPVDIPSRIPLLGMLFRMGENAFVGSSRYMRYQLAKQYLSVWRKSGVPLDKRQLESIGRLANSQTGRGEVAGQGKKPGLLNNVFWSPRNLRAYVDILTVHAFDRNISAFARKQAAINLIRYISGAAMILALAKWIDDDSVTWDSKSSDFGKIRVGGTRFSVGGGMAILVILASRLIQREFTSSTSGETKSIDTGKFGALGGKDLVWNFVENKLSPAAGLALSIIEQKTWKGDQLTIPQMVDDALTPLIVQNVMETGSSDDSANVLAALMAEAMGVNVQTYSNKKKQTSKLESIVR